MLIFIDPDVCIVVNALNAKWRVRVERCSTGAMFISLQISLRFGTMGT